MSDDIEILSALEKRTFIKDLKGLDSATLLEDPDIRFKYMFVFVDLFGGNYSWVLNFYFDDANSLGPCVVINDVNKRDPFRNF